MRNFNKARGLADWAFIAIIVGAVSLIGTLIPKVTNKVDTPLEQLAEQIIKMQTGEEVDFSAHLKKLPDGTVVATTPTVVSKVIVTDGKVPVEFRK